MLSGNCPNNIEIMRYIVLYETIFICCLIISTVKGDKKWNNNDENLDKNKLNQVVRGSKKAKYGNREDAFEDQHKNSLDNIQTKEGNSKNINNNKNKPKKSTKRENVSEGSAEKATYHKKKEGSKKENGNGKNKKNVHEENDRSEKPKRFIGRIEHGKVKVLRIREPVANDDSDENTEKFCSKAKRGKSGNDSSEEEQGCDKYKPKKKIKYSIKFQHEKQRKQISNGDISIMRLHKNGKKKYGNHDDDGSSSEEDDGVFPKRFHLADDDDE